MELVFINSQRGTFEKSSSWQALFQGRGDDLELLNARASIGTVLNKFPEFEGLTCKQLDRFFKMLFFR